MSNWPETEFVADLRDILARWNISNPRDDFVDALMDLIEEAYLQGAESVI